MYSIHHPYNKHPLYKQPKMTYILGTRCKDGVVLIADRKFTIDAGAGYEYDDKLFGDLAGVIVGFFRFQRYI